MSQRNRPLGMEAKKGGCQAELYQPGVRGVSIDLLISCLCGYKYGVGMLYYQGCSSMAYLHLFLGLRMRINFQEIMGGCLSICIHCVKI